MTEDRLIGLYRTYGPSLYARCRQILGDAAEAEDAAQEAFLRLHRRLDGDVDARQALAWVWKVATHHCLNLLRNRRRQALPVEKLPEAASAHLEAHLVDVDYARRLIATAPRKVAEVAWLHHVDGLTQEEVASVLDISRRTVVYRLADFQHHARTFEGRSFP